MTGPEPGDAPPPAAAPLAVRCDNLVHVYGTPGSEVAALRGVDLTVRPREMVALLGPSGPARPPCSGIWPACCGLPRAGWRSTGGGSPTSVPVRWPASG